MYDIVGKTAALHDWQKPEFNTALFKATCRFVSVLVPQTGSGSKERADGLVLPCCETTFNVVNSSAHVHEHSNPHAGTMPACSARGWSSSWSWTLRAHPAMSSYTSTAA